MFFYERVLIRYDFFYLVPERKVIIIINIIVLRHFLKSKIFDQILAID